MPATVSRLFVYPVKSFGGIALDASDVDAFGLRFDRRWMVLDRHGAFQTQRWRPRMALVRTALMPDGRVSLSAPDMPPLLVPQGGGPVREAVVWKDSCRAESCGVEADAWLSAFLGEPCHFVFMPDDSVRPIREGIGAPGRVSFADAYPFLLLSEASLDDLNARLPVPLPVNRFRPNIVVSGIDAYAEDDWPALEAGSVRFAVAKRCVRCVLTTIDQETAEGGTEPLRTLATYRRVPDGVVFGVNLAHARPGRVSVGDRVLPIASG
ncbi:MAG TPA: MOSC N-terminal beta barrel domain-containing protein [Gemmatimonadales bacterium]|nr:MOSC N-terminal beta barrel domain-containing protein [Gemmatimonadales bacterium]